MTGISYGEGGTKRSIDKVYYQDGGTRRTIKNAYYQDGSSRRLVYAAYTPITTVTIGGTTIVTWPTTTFDLTASSNGSATSKTYAWTKVSGSSFLSISGSTTSAAVHIVSSRSNSSFSSDSATFRCTVSDGTSSAFKDVTVTSNGLV